MYKYKSSRNDKVCFSKQRGLTLIELLVATSLGIVVVLGVTNSMTSLLHSSRVQDGAIDMQETADLAFSYIGSRLKNSISTPCNGIKGLDSLNVSSLGSNKSKEIREMITGSGLSIRQKNRVLVGAGTHKTDDISLISSLDRVFLDPDEETGITSSKEAISTINLQTSFPSSIADDGKGDKYGLYAITNCDVMDVFRASRAVNASNTTLKTFPGTAFSINYRGRDVALVSRFTVASLGVDDSGSLFYQPTYGATKGNTLLQNVELMRVVFGVDTTGNGSVDRYLTAKYFEEKKEEDEKDRWLSTYRIVSAKIYMLVKASEASMSVASEYAIKMPDTSVDFPKNGKLSMQTITFTDKIMRKVFSQSISFRNGASL